MQRPPPLLEALADVREIRRRVLEHQLFLGYSGRARMAGGCLALVGALILSQGWIPSASDVHVAGWGMVCAIAAVINFGALAFWWRRRQSELVHLRPVLDLVAPFSVGGLLTFSLITRSEYDLLFPMWMWLFGLMNISSRHSLPKTMMYLGWYYIAAGSICVLSLPYTSFTNPWPMGIVFFIGETLGGFTFIKLRKSEEV